MLVDSFLLFFLFFLYLCRCRRAEISMGWLGQIAWMEHKLEGT